MRRSQSVATLVLAIGAGWLAAKMWNQNVGGVQDKVRAGSSRVRLRGGEMIDRGRQMADEAWERGRQMADEWSEKGRGMARRGRQGPERGYADYDYPERSFGQRHPLDSRDDTRSSGYYGEL